MGYFAMLDTSWQPAQFINRLTLLWVFVDEDDLIIHYEEVEGDSIEIPLEKFGGTNKN